MYSPLASEIWQDLRNRFQQKNGPRIFQLRKELMLLVQGHDSGNQYFTKLKVIWEELSSFKPICNCTCGGLRPMEDHCQMEYVMSFLMGVNDSFAQVRGQILLMEPIPPISKVFSLILEEDTQREVGAAQPFAITHQLAFAVKNADKPRQGKKDRPLCSHCGVLGHTVDKCFKIHGYPPSFKPKSKSVSVSSSHTVNQVSESSVDTSTTATLTALQCQQLISMLSTQLANTSTQEPTSAQGQIMFDEDWQG
ncbi:Retrotransposon gag domain [Sesbania bispinosa]|nr:Retrotransposon gag domain [Sesbania bispinosa]